MGKFRRKFLIFKFFLMKFPLPEGKEGKNLNRLQDCELKMKNIDKIISISSEAISYEDPQDIVNLIHDFGERHIELIEMLTIKNGFYAFESALHIFPSRSDEQMDLVKWNDRKLWISDYGDIKENLFFFGEDIFGCQFCIDDKKISIFDPETALCNPFAESMDDFMEKVLSDYNVVVGYSIAHEWQMRNGKTPEGKRLAPKIPFILGGEFEIDNLMCVNCVESMKFRAYIYNQTKDLPDGTKVNLKIED